MKDFPAARDALAIWKHSQLIAYACALLRAGFAERAAGRPCFGSDNVPDADLPQDLESRHSIPGSAAAMLRSAGCIADNFLTYSEMGVYGGRRKSGRETANGRKIGTYTLIVPVAEEFLRRNGQPVRVEQRAEQVDMKMEGVA